MKYIARVSDDSSIVVLRALFTCRTLASFDLPVNMFQKFSTSLVDCLRYRFSLCQVHKFFYRHIAKFSRGNFSVCLCNHFQASLLETFEPHFINLTDLPAFSIVQQNGLHKAYMQVDSSFYFDVFGSLGAFIQLICFRTCNVYTSVDVFTTFSISTDDGSKIWSSLHIWSLPL